MVNKSWGGRFTQSNAEVVKHFNQSVEFDKVLAPYDIKGSIAHAKMLNKTKILKDDEAKKIIAGLETISKEIENNKFSWSVDLEDVHMNIEARLIEICGDVGKKLHTARSRNDQVATDIRLYLLDEIEFIINEIIRLQKNLLKIAKQEVKTIMPGFTHLQAAQPISFAHHLLAYFEMFYRDKSRLIDCKKRINILPLGSAALAGTTYPIDREYVAQILGFDAVSENSIDAVSDRDFAIEFLSTASMIMMHLSRFSEELILWSSAQFNFIEIADSYCTGSSIMPQKKNPDVPELVRGKTARTYGNLMALLTLMKAQPLAYNKDNQEDKEPIFDTVNTLKNCIIIFADMLPTITINRENMYNSTEKGYTTATDLADYLVKKSIPFRDAHEIVGKVVSYAIKNNKNLEQLSLKELNNFSNVFAADVFKCITIKDSINARNHIGGTAFTEVLKAIKRAEKKL